MPPTPARCSRSRPATSRAAAASTSPSRSATTASATPTKLRFTGTAIETVEAAVLTRDVERNEVLKSSDVDHRAASEGRSRQRRRRARPRGRHADAQAASRRPGRCKVADLAKPDLVQRDDNVTLIYESAGLYLTIRGKALEGGTEGDVVNVLNLQSKRTVSGVVIGRGQVAISVATPRLPPADRCILLGRRGRNRRTGFGRRRQQFASVSKSRVTFMFTSSINRIALAGTLADDRQRRGGGCSSIDRLSQIGETAETVVDRQSDGAARLQAGADADAETGSGVLQRQFAVAERLARRSSRTSARTRSATS